LGTGYSSIGLATDSDFLRMLGETGILGFLAFWLIFARIGKLFVKSIPVLKNMTGLEQCFIVGMLGAIIGTFISSTFIDLFEASKFATIFWFMTGYSVYLIRSHLNE
jgi:O-antigen ligase